MLTAKKKSSRGAADPAVPAPPDPREPLPQTPASWELVLTQLRAVLADLPKPESPKKTELFEALLHIYFADGMPCGYGQEARRRIVTSFVDWNEFRVTEAYEVEDLLRDLQIPSLFERCLWVRESVAQVYNDQNGVKLDFLREAGVGDRNNFFQRTPALRPHVVAFLTNLLTVEDLCFSDKSLVRSQQRLGLDGKDVGGSFVTEVRALLQPYGHLPLEVGKHLPAGRPNLTHPLSPASLLVRLLPGSRKKG